MRPGATSSIRCRSETAGKPFDLEHSLISSRDRAAIPVVVYDKAKADGIALESSAPNAYGIALSPIWPEDRPHLPIAEIADWFATYVYLPKLRDRSFWKPRSGTPLANSIRSSDTPMDSMRQPGGIAT